MSQAVVALGASALIVVMLVKVGSAQVAAALLEVQIVPMPLRMAAREPAARTLRWQQGEQVRAVQRALMLDFRMRLLMCLPRMLPEPAARTRTAQRNSHFA
jgi:hypothetical protein